MIRVVFQWLGFQVIQVCLRFSVFVSSFGVVWRFKVVELCSAGLLRVVYNCLVFGAVYVCLGFRFVQVC